MSISIEDHPDSNKFHAMIKSLIESRLEDHCILCNIQVELSQSDDKRVPHTVNIKAILANKEVVETTASSVNSLAAFTQALQRLERRFDKMKYARRA